MRARDLEGFGPVGTNGTAPTVAQDLDTMRDVYMTLSQQRAFDRLAAIVRAWEAAPVGVVRVDDSDYLHVRCEGRGPDSDDLYGQRVRLVPVETGAAT